MASVRQKILAVAKARLRKEGELAIQVQTLCEQARVSRTSFYREFRNLNDVVASLALLRWRRGLELLVEQCESAPPSRDSYRDFLVTFVIKSQGEAAHLEGGDGLTSVIELMYRDESLYLKQLTDVLGPFVQRGQQLGLVRTGVRPEVLCDWLMRQIWSLTSVPFPAQYADQNLVDYLDNFICPAFLCQQPEGELQADLLTRMDTVTQALKRIEDHIFRYDVEGKKP